MSSNDYAPSTLENPWKEFSSLLKAGIGSVTTVSELRDLENEDLEAAICQAQDALDKTPKGHPDRPGRLHSLGVSHQNRYREKREKADVEALIRCFEETVNLTPVDHPDRTDRLQSLGVGFLSRYFDTGDTADLEAGVQWSKEANEATPNDHQDKACRLHSLGSAYLSRFMYSGMLLDLETAIQYLQRAFDATPDSHHEWEGRLYSLGKAHLDRYFHTNAMADLETALQQFQTTMSRTPDGHPFCATRLNSLGNALHQRYIRTGVRAELVRAHSCFQDALNEARDPLTRAWILDSLGRVNQTEYQEHKGRGFLNIAIGYHQRALDEMPIGHPGRANLLDALGHAHNARYSTEISTVGDIQAACQYLQESVDITPVNHPALSSRLYALSLATLWKELEIGGEEGEAAAIQRLREALGNDASPIPIRIRAGKRLSAIHAERKNWSLSSEAALETMSLIPRLTPRFLDNSDKQYLLAEVVDMASDAATLALKTGNTPYEAIRLLELGRGVVAGSLSDLRTDVSDLQEEYPQLANDYCRYRDQLDTPSVSADQVSQRHEAGQNLDRTIQAIRQLPAFSRFLMGPSEDELKSCASSGPIVVVNASNYGCHALIIEKTKLRALELTRLSKGAIRSRVGMLQNSKSTSDIMGWLWDAIAEPILDTLGFIETPNDNWPHLWWIATGPLSKFPLHAAGRHDLGTFNTVLDRVISSYSSSVRTLFQSHQRRYEGGLSGGIGKALLVGVEKTPGQNNLPFVPQEIERLRCICNTMQLQVASPFPSLEHILQDLKDCDIFHFAGHGSTNPLDPSKSSLLLGGSGERLTVASLLEMNLHKRNPFLAYLSACGTGQIKHDVLIDEALHLISAYQIAGFRHVIGTLWEVNDQSCVEVASITYEWMKENGTGDASVSEGLHHVIRKLRDEWILESTCRGSNPVVDDERKESSVGERNVVLDLEKDLPLLWVPYVHFGV